MELQVPSFPLFLCFLLFLFMVFKTVKRSKPNPKLPPGPWKLPIIGSLHHLIGSLPHHRLRELAKKHGPLMHLQLGEISAMVVSSPKVAKEVLKTHDRIFAHRPKILTAEIMTYNLTDIAFSPNGNYWKQLRKICFTELLSGKRVQSFSLIREEEVSNLIQSILSTAGSPINLSEKIFSLSYGVTSRSAFGKKSKDQETFISVVREAIKLSAGFDLADLFPSIKLLELITWMRPKLESMQRELDRIFDDIIDDHKAKKVTAKSGKGELIEEDLVDVLLRLQNQGGLEIPITMDNIKAVILDVFSAGSETSAGTVDWAISEMLKNPRVMEKAQVELRQVLKGRKYVNDADIQELSYLKLIIKETLRLHPPAPFLLPRENQESCEIDGYEIPVKTKVIINAWAIGRDPEHWENAEKFEPERFNGNSFDFNGNNLEYIPFGAGRRICPGILFGSANMEHTLAQLLYHFDWKLPNGANPEDLDMTEAFGVTVRRKNDLYLIPIPYNPVPLE